MTEPPRHRVAFEPEAFVAECQAVAAGADPLGAVRAVVACSHCRRPVDRCSLREQDALHR